MQHCAQQDRANFLQLLARKPCANKNAGVIALAILLAVLGLGLFAVALIWNKTMATPTPRTELASSLPSPLPRLVTIGTQSLLAELATTPEQWATGLMNRSSLPENAGMLFLFPAEEQHTFWMKNTLIPLDLIWIRKNRVVGITTDARPEPNTQESDLRRYTSPELVNAVIEVNAGWPEVHEIAVGDTVKY